MDDDIIGKKVSASVARGSQQQAARNPGPPQAASCSRRNPSARSRAARPPRRPPYHAILTGWAARGIRSLSQAKRGTWTRTFQDWRTVILVTGALGIVVFFLFHLVSDGDFSFLMVSPGSRGSLAPPRATADSGVATPARCHLPSLPLPAPPQTISNLLRLSSMIVLLYKGFADPTGVSEISLKTLQCSCCVSVFRLSSILFYEGYLPFDSSGDWFYQTVEVLTLLAAGFLMLLMTTTKKHQYNPKNDVFGTEISAVLPPHLGALALIVPAVVVAALFHPNLNGNFVTDAAWSAALYLETVAILPQDRMFRSRGGRLHELTSLAVFMIGASGVLNLVFWLFSFAELNAAYSSHFGHSYPGYVVVICQFINLVIMFDFLRRYIQAAATGRPPVLPV